MPPDTVDDGLFTFVGSGTCTDSSSDPYTNYFYYSDTIFSNNDAGVAACGNKCKLSMKVGFVGFSIERAEVRVAMNVCVEPPHQYPDAVLLKSRCNCIYDKGHRLPERIGEATLNHVHYGICVFVPVHASSLWVETLQASGFDVESVPSNFGYQMGSSLISLVMQCKRGVLSATLSPGTDTGRNPAPPGICTL